MGNRLTTCHEWESNIRPHQSTTAHTHECIEDGLPCHCTDQTSFGKKSVQQKEEDEEYSAKVHHPAKVEVVECLVEGTGLPVADEFTWEQQEALDNVD